MQWTNTRLQKENKKREKLPLDPLASTTFHIIVRLVYSEVS